MKALVYNIKKYISIFLHLKKIEVMSVMAYPVPFLINLFTATFVMVLGVLFVRINFAYINSIQGWDYYAVLGIVGSYMVIDGAMWFLFSMLNAINSFIQNGSMDGMILKPIDLQFLTSVWKGDLEDLSRITVGIVLVRLSIINTIGFESLHFMMYLLLLLNGVIIFYSVSICLRAVSFWTIEGWGIWMLLDRLSGNSQYPIDIYRNKFVRGFFTFIIPLAFVATVPARILTNIDIDWKLVGLSFLMCIVFFLGSRWFWKFSLKHYSSASS